jgi:hypothetical protein
MEANEMTQSMQPSSKYVKQNEFLYHQYMGDKKIDAWHTSPVRIGIVLYKIQHVVSVSLEGKGVISQNLEEDLKRKQELRLLNNEEIFPCRLSDETINKLTHYAAEEMTTDGKKQEIRHAIRAKAVFSDEISVVKDGQKQRKYLKVADFVCHEGNGLGYMGHDTDDIALTVNSKVYTDIVTYLPSEGFQILLQQLKEGKVTQGFGCIRTSIFRSELCTNLSEKPWECEAMIEAGSYVSCGIDSITFENKQYSSFPKWVDKLCSLLNSHHILSEKKDGLKNTVRYLLRIDFDENEEISQAFLMKKIDTEYSHKENPLEAFQEDLISEMGINCPPSLKNQKYGPMPYDEAVGDSQKTDLNQSLTAEMKIMQLVIAELRQMNKLFKVCAFVLGVIGVFWLFR